MNINAKQSYYKGSLKHYAVYKTTINYVFESVQSGTQCSNFIERTFVKKKQNWSQTIITNYYDETFVEIVLRSIVDVLK